MIFSPVSNFGDQSLFRILILQVLSVNRFSIAGADLADSNKIAGAKEPIAPVLNRPLLFGRHNLPPLVGIGLTDL